MRHVGLIAVLALSVAGCGGDNGTYAPPSGTEAAAPAIEDSASEAPTQAPSLAKGRDEKDENDLYEFAYAYPDAAAAIPDLKALLDQRLDAAKADLISTAKSDRAEAAKDGFPYHAHSFQAGWKVVTNLPDFLSLSSDIYTYSGGAHGMSAFDTLVWDRRTGEARDPQAFFASKDALRNAIQPAFCDALDKQREKKRGEPVQRGSGQMFTECIDPVASTLILGSANGRTFDRIGILVGPYEAGPYAEGPYEVTLPVTARVIAAVKPQYKGSFSPGN